MPAKRQPIRTLRGNENLEPQQQMKSRGKQKINARVFLELAFSLMSDAINDDDNELQLSGCVVSENWVDVLESNLQRWGPRVQMMTRAERLCFLKDKVAALKKFRKMLQDYCYYVDEEFVLVFARYSNLVDKVMDENSGTLPIKKRNGIFATLKREFGHSRVEVERIIRHITKLFGLTLRLQLPFQSVCPYPLTKCRKFDEHYKRLKTDLMKSGAVRLAPPRRQSDFGSPSVAHRKTKISPNTKTMNDPELEHLFSPAHICALLHNQGHQPVVSRAVLSAALEVLDRADKENVLQGAKQFFRSKAVILPDGLETLPAAWLSRLPELLWRTRKTKWEVLPYMIRELKAEDGVLCIKFAQELPRSGERDTAWDRLRIKINLGVSPNLWTPLCPELERRIWAARPQLRTELFQLLV